MTTPQNLVMADELGQLEGHFTIPRGVPSGSRLVEFVGDNQSSYASANYVGTRSVRIKTIREIRTQVFGRAVPTRRRRPTLTRRGTMWYFCDPLAQTFTLTQGHHLAWLDVFFTKIGQKSVRVQIREAELGQPSPVVLAESQQSVAQFKSRSTGELQAVRFEFDPIYLEGGLEYALVVMTDDAEHELAIAKLGEYDQQGRLWVRAQAYQTGVLLSSSNAQTWTAHQDMDLMFELGALQFKALDAESTGLPSYCHEVVLHDNLALKDISDVMLRAAVDTPEPEQSVRFQLHVNDQAIDLQLNELTKLDKHVTGTGKIVALLQGTQSASPQVFPSIQLLLGKMNKQAVYVTRSMDFNLNSVQVEFDASLASWQHTSENQAEVQVYVLPYYQGVQGEKIRLSNSVVLDSDFKHHLYQHHFDPDLRPEKIQVALVLQGNAKARPQVKNLSILSL